MKIKLLIAGSRSLSLSPQELGIHILKYWKLEEIGEVVSGNAAGIDVIGEAWAIEHMIPVKRFRPDWKTHGKIAGILRNQEMANYADAGLIIWDGISSGSANMLANMEIRDKYVEMLHKDKIAGIKEQKLEF